MLAFGSHSGHMDGYKSRGIHFVGPEEWFFNILFADF